MKSMSILFGFSVFFANMVGLHNAEEMGLHEACKSNARFQSGEEMGLFLPLGSLARPPFYTSRLSTKVTRFNCPVLEPLFKCVERVNINFDGEATVSSV